VSAPLIALTTGLELTAGPYEKPRVTVYSAYIDALQPLGLAPVLVTPAHSLEAVQSLLVACDGLVLSGGGDIDPVHFGQAPSPHLDYVLPARDAVEFAALRIALQREIPILGICRGCQVLNVHLGGTLYQDLAADRPGSTGHRQNTWTDRVHEIDVMPGSRLRTAVGSDKLRVNTFHHQAIDVVAGGLEVTAIADDGVIEAVEVRDHPWAVAVQWHPERHEATAPDTDPDRRLFATFADAVTSHRGASL
jgi:putative glutamine amidotransferase